MLCGVQTPSIPTDEMPTELVLEATDTAFDETEAGGWVARAACNAACTTADKTLR